MQLVYAMSQHQFYKNCLKFRQTYRHEAVLIDNHYAAKSEPDWISRSAVEKHVYLQHT